MLIQRGITGRCHVYRTLGLRTAPSRSTVTLPYELGIRARAAASINQPRQRVYDFWRNLENLPRFMRHLVAVEFEGENRSRWVARGPRGKEYTWLAEIINESPGELIAWRSLPGSEIDNAGSVRFSDAPGGRGTEIRVELQYNPPGGTAGAWIARILGRDPQQEMQGDLGRLKQYLEAGELATAKGQPMGPKHPGRAEAGRHYQPSALDEAIA
jgi:uncharacterized membrane protein